MSALVIYESMWGNTRTVAEAIARGLGPDVPAVDVMEAPPMLPPDVDLLVIGGPTHAFSMSRPSTREDAVEKGAAPEHAGTGIREWIAQQSAADIAVATFDTRVRTVRRLPGSAAKAAARSASRHHLGTVVGAESFFVEDMQGPLLSGEADRATAWGASLTDTAVRRGR